MKTPKINLPKINLPKINLPKINLPKINLPKINLPKINLPKINLPKINLPKIHNEEQQSGIDREKEKRIFGIESKFIRVKRQPDKSKHVKYSNATALVKDVGRVEKNDVIHALVNGSFIMADFVEAFIVEQNIHAKKMYISTLSISISAIDSIVNLMEGGFVDELVFLFSDFSFAHNLEAGGAVGHLYASLKKYKHQIIVANNHTKVIAFETFDFDFFCDSRKFKHKVVGINRKLFYRKLRKFVLFLG